MFYIYKNKCKETNIINDEEDNKDNKDKENEKHRL